MQSDKHKALLEEKPLIAIVKFSIFFIIGDLFQQLYNIVDSIVVGNYVNEQALACLGAASPIMSLIMFVIIGFTIGSGIVFSKYYGKGDYNSLKESESTALIIGLIFTLIITIVSFCFCETFLKLLNTPDSILVDSKKYLYIIFAANFFTFLYNFYCYAIRSIGNSFTPLLFLIASTLINVILDLIFVIGFKWEVEGAAFATFLAQMCSCIMIILYTNRKIDILRLDKKEFSFYKSKAKEVLSFSTSVALQQSFVYIGRISVQGLFNSYGTHVIAGVNVAEKVNSLFQTPFRGYANAATTYFSQNLGANRKDRIISGYKSTWLIVLINSIIFVLLGTLFSTQIADMFMDEKSIEAIGYGSKFIFAMSIGVPLAFIIVQHQSFMRGVGKLKPFFMSTFIVILCRIILSYTLDHFYGVESAFYAPTFSWIVGSIFNIIVCFIIYIKNFKLAKKEENLT